MSNARHLTQLNPGSGQRARPRQTWRGYRPPRSARKRWEHWMAHQRYLDQALANALKMPEAPKHPVIEAVESQGIVLTPQQEDLVTKVYDTEGKIEVA